MSECLKCQKEYIPKRRGGKFCSVSCRVGYHQKVQRGHSIVNPPTSDEVYLVEKMLAVGKLASKLVEDMSLPKEQRPTDLFTRTKELASLFVTFTNNTIVESIERREAERKKAEYKAYRDKTGLY
jgi:hypothetical protein